MELIDKIKEVRDRNIPFSSLSNDEIIMAVERGYLRFRKLTPRTTFRLMGVRDDDIDKMLSCGVSNSQLYKMAGNSIVVDTLAAIFDKMFNDKTAAKGEQLKLF